jgi:DNA integrity scanning protein DisA with diadenylate cyclase activity
MSDYLHRIAAGETFDTVQAIRILAQTIAQMIDLRPRTAMIAERTANTPPQLQRLYALLATAGYDTLNQVRAASDEDLGKIPGITRKGLATIRADTRDTEGEL